MWAAQDTRGYRRRSENYARASVEECQMRVDDDLGVVDCCLGGPQGCVRDIQAEGLLQSSALQKKGLTCASIFERNPCTKPPSNITTLFALILSPVVDG
jgi:hypothetical protein